MSKIRALIICLFLIFQTGTALCTQFVEGFEDVPLMPELEQSVSDTLSFGNEEAGYTEVVLQAKKRLSFDKVKQFYCETLAQMGWTRLDLSKTSFSFVRENDILEILQTQKKPLKITISLKSKN